MSPDEITAPMILPEDVLVIPTAELAVRDRERISASDGEFVVTRQHARRPSQLLGRHAAGILARFRVATPIARAVAEYGHDHDLDARALLRDAYPALRACLAGRLLVRADSAAARRIAPTLGSGERVGALTVMRCVRVLDDTEVYQGEGPAGDALALKILRPEPAEETSRALDREATMLARLDGVAAPLLLERIVFEERPALVMTWCDGVAPTIVAEEIRTGPAEERDERLLRLGETVLETYAALHERAVVHGDVHPGNVLVDRHFDVRLVDFGYSRLDADANGLDAVPRAGVAYYADPQYAAARMARRPPRLADRRAEQYSIAAMLYLLVAGAHTRDFMAEEDEVWRRICEEGPLPFSRRGVPPWPDAERVLRRALAQRPAERWASLTEMLAAWRGIAPRRPSRRRTARRLLDGRADLGGFARASVARLQVPGALWSGPPLGAPSCSLSLGAAGIAYALYRLACVQDRPAHLFGADAWLARAEAQLSSSGAFYDEAAGLGPERLGRSSPYHTAAGVHAVRALVSGALGEHGAATRALERFVAASATGLPDVTDHPETRTALDIGFAVDLWLGRAGTLLGCAVLEAALAFDRPGSRPLLALGDRIADELGTAVRSWGPLPGNAALPGYGMAHGWAGVLYAVLRWRSATGRRPDRWLESRLDELAGCAAPCGRGTVWSPNHRRSGPDGVSDGAPGWCGGSAGFVLLWSFAAERCGRRDYEELAERAAWHTWEGGATPAHLCCGYAGRAYALLDRYARTGDTAWRSRAERLAARAVSTRSTLAQGGDAAWAPRSLFRGEVGLALLVSELATPEIACMPFVGDERWPSPPRAG